MVTYNNILNVEWSRINRIKDWLKVKIIDDVIYICDGETNLYRMIIGCISTYIKYKNKIPQEEFFEILNNLKNNKENMWELEIVADYFRKEGKLIDFIEREEQAIRKYKVPEKKEKTHDFIGGLDD